MANAYKGMKENFVANLPGGELSEINYVTAVAPAALVLWSALQSRLSYFTPYTLEAFVLDYLLNCGAILFATTVYSSNPILLNILLLTPAFFVSAVLRSDARRRRRRQPHQKKEAISSRPATSTTDDSVASTDDLPRKPFLTTYRGSMLVITSIAILAVDFPIFPRRFAKVETWGTSLMDLGVGSFVFSAGITSARGVLKERIRKREPADGRPSNNRSSLIRRLAQSTSHGFPLLLLGIVRLMSVKRLSYQEHVTEYGIHWNFFFTLALLPPFSALFQALFAFVPSYALLSMVVGMTYHLLLENMELKRYIITAPRTDFISMNREGIFSFFGYLSIFLAGQSAGMSLLQRRPASSAATSSPPSSAQSRLSNIRTYIRALPTRDPLLTYLILATLSWTALFNLLASRTYSPLLYIASSSAASVSRRLANLPYILWVISYNTTQLLVFYVVHEFFFPDDHNADDGVQTAKEIRKSDTTISPVLVAFNANALPLFILANVLTGIINLSIDTLHASSMTAMGVLIAYILCLAGLAVFVFPATAGSQQKKSLWRLGM